MTMNTTDSVLYSPTASMAQADVQSMPMASMANVAAMIFAERTPIISTIINNASSSHPERVTPLTAASISS